MERIIYRKTLDVHKNGTQFVLQGFETADKLSRVVEISLMASGDAIDFPLERIVAVMYVTTPGASEPSINECTIKDNKVIYDVLPVVEEGITTMQLKIIETSIGGAKRVLASPKFAVEVTKSNINDEGTELDNYVSAEFEEYVSENKDYKPNPKFTAIEEFISMAEAAYGTRLKGIELTSDCIFRATYYDGTTYETDVLQKLFLNGNVLLSESFAHGGTGVRAGEDTDNSKYYSNVSKSEALNAKAIMENSEDILEEVRLHGVYTAFSVDFSTGEVEYVSPKHRFSINKETGELESETQTYTFQEEIYRVVEDWLETNNITISDLQTISETHSGEIAETKALTALHTQAIESTNKDVDDLKTKDLEIEGKLDGDVLWENPDLDTDFKAQTIAMDLTAYKHFALLFTIGNISYGEQTCHIKDTYISFGYYLPNYHSIRKVMFSNTGITFSNDYIAKHYNGNSDSGGPIPIKIIGYKY